MREVNNLHFGRVLQHRNGLYITWYKLGKNLNLSHKSVDIKYNVLYSSRNRSKIILVFVSKSVLTESEHFFIFTASLTLCEEPIRILKFCLGGII